MVDRDSITTKKSKLPDIQHVETNEFDCDAQRLRDLGYKQEFKREINLLAQIGFCFTTMGVLPNWMVGFGPIIGSGGPSSLFWGMIVVAPFVMCIALSMAEVVSAYPLAGGIYSWCFLLSNKEWGPFMAWIGGYLYLIGLVTANITLSWSVSEFVIGIANTVNETQIESQGVYVGLYCCVFFLATAYNFLGIRFSAYLNKFLLFWVGVGTIVIICTVPAMAPKHNSAKWVFTEFTNTTGYTNQGLVFLLGLLQAGWTLIGYECGVQIVEGTKKADITAPRGIIVCVISAIVQGFAIILITLFSIQDVEALFESSMPVATFFLQATNARLTTFFLAIMVLAQFGSLCNSILATVHIIWALSRDGCLPFSKTFYQLNEKTKVPGRALIFQLIISIAIIMPSFGSGVYWQAIMSTSVISINASYGLPLLSRLLWVRNDMPKGPFSLGKCSLPLNIISIIWISFFSVILCIPSVSPVTPGTMNWASVMIVGVLNLSILFWLVSGRKNYKGPVENSDE